jgi:1,4-alpha-glucan branching enzyme
MQIQIWYSPAEPRSAVFIHAWDQNGKVWDLPGSLAPDGTTWGFALSGTTQDQRDVSFKYRFGAGVWEADSWIRTVPSLEATELWTEDDSPRCATVAPGGPATFSNVTVNAISEHRFNGGAVYVWTPSSDSRTLFYQSARNDASNTSSFVIPLTDGLKSGFHFKLVGPAGQPPFSDFEADTANRFWNPSDGASVWVKSGQVEVQSQAITSISVGVDFFFPLVLGTPNLRIQDMVGDFDDTLNPGATASLDAVFGTSHYTISVYVGALYNLWWTTEPQTLMRRFRIPLEGSGGPTIAVNGYDHWLATPPAPNGQVKLIIHPNPGSTFGGTVGVQVGIGEAAAHQTLNALGSGDGTWVAQLDTFPGIPFWATLTGESRPDGPLDFRRGIMSTAGSTTLHTIDGVGGVSILPPGGFLDASPSLRQSLMEAVFGQSIARAGVFDPWEMPHGSNKWQGQAYFVVRAPHAVSCSALLMGTPNQPGAPRNVTSVPMNLTNDLRYWWAAVAEANVPHGSLYRFAYSDGWELLAPSGRFGESLDPACRWALDKGSLVVDAGTGAEQSWSYIADLAVIGAPLGGHTWTTGGWDWLLIYEMHAHRFTQRNAGAATDFDQMIQELQTGYLERLPVTALEFLPLHEFPADQAGWGYNPSLFFAIDSSYGGPADFANMVRAAHDASRAIILDLVYNHLIESPLQVLARDVYVSGATQWGDMVYFAHPAACEFFRQATVYLWSFFQLDGFRFDSTETIVNGGHYTDSTPYVIANGPDGNYEFGAGKGWEFLGMLSAALRRAADASERVWPYLVGENAPENPPMTDPSTGVLDGQWHFDEMYALNNAAINADDYSSDVRGGLDRAGRPFQRSVIYGESHDTASGQGPTKRIAATEKWGNGRQMAKAIGTVALLTQGIPMIFMGEEAAEDQAFVFGASAASPGFTLNLDAYEQSGGEFLQVLTWFRDLMGLRNNAANGLRGNDNQPTGQGFKTVSFTRSNGSLFVIATFGTNTPQQNLAWLGLPSGSPYKEIFNSSWPQYQVHGEPMVSNGGYDARLYSGNIINLPPIGAVILQRS